ncbi:putative poly(ADP-ribose) glycohydrolase 2 [Cardamine amara subsp. amara]|uniref:Poly(ADP-ribose) glycohydrolase 2 n=1 Tax=Cardamine amara subsp. amara TaxID=228776 RepID=A0ABD1B8C2_CARAN
MRVHIQESLNTNQNASSERPIRLSLVSSTSARIRTMGKCIDHEDGVGTATWNWGCAAYGGDPELKSLLQWLDVSQVWIYEKMQINVEA